MVGNIGVGPIASILSGWHSTVELIPIVVDAVGLEPTTACV